MTIIKETVASDLLKIGAVQLNPEDPFTWASGLKSPIYCDNRLVLSFPEVRQRVINAFVELIKENYPNVEVIAGCATAGIPHAAWISQAMNLPMVYVRGKAKDHGKRRQIEGTFTTGQKTVVVEDLISTGGSVLNAVEVLKEQGAEILGVAAIFTYGLQQSADNFTNKNVELKTLTDFSHLMTEAVQQHKIKEEHINQLNKWIEDPASEAWMKEK